jgi:deoxyribonuclease V
MTDVAAWPQTVAEARRLQQTLAPRVIRRGTAAGVTCVAGVDVHVRGEVAVAVAALVELPELDLIESAVAERPVTFPYVPGYLAFREVPVALDALRALGRPPDALLVDGHGLAHPRRFGLACHLGVVMDLPTAGCAKSRLIGRHGAPAATRGSTTALREGAQQIGTVLRTRDGVSPIFVSIGHRLTLRAAVSLALSCTGRFRQPEPLRQAHQAARARARK